MRCVSISNSEQKLKTLDGDDILKEVFHKMFVYIIMLNMN